MPERLLAELQATLQREIPMCAEMGIQVHAFGDRGLTMRAPLARNRNHQKTAFAGSLNALCTVTGWGSVFLLARQHGLPGDVVIRRSAIKYLKPVDSDEIFATCTMATPEAREHFVEMLKDKGQAKLDLRVEIQQDSQPAVTFAGSYVVLGREPQ